MIKIRITTTTTAELLYLRHPPIVHDPSPQCSLSGEGQGIPFLLSRGGKVEAKVLRHDSVSHVMGEKIGFAPLIPPIGESRTICHLLIRGRHVYTVN